MPQLKYTLRKYAGGYRVLFGGEEVGRLVRDKRIRADKSGQGWEFGFSDSLGRGTFDTLAQARAWLESVREARIAMHETPEFKRIVADACGKHPRQRSDLERALIARAFGSN